MPLLPPSRSLNRSRLADWLELYALTSQKGFANSNDLKRMLEANADGDQHGVLHDEITGEPLEKEILEPETDDALSRVYEELGYRARLCGANYPFKLASTDVLGGGYKLEPDSYDMDSNSPHIFYLLGLIETALRDQIIAVQNVAVSSHRLGLLFQIVGCLAVGGYLRGTVVWFGFPRPDHSAFLPALQSAFARFGAHEVLTTIPPGYPEQLKDAGIDIIAWLDFHDKRGSRVILAAQVASGYDWSKKTLLGYIPKLLNWFLPPQPAHIRPAILIPFPCYHELEERSDIPWDKQAEGRMLYESSDFGVIFDRFRVANCAVRALALSADEKSNVDGFDELGQVAAWLAEILAELKPEAA